MMRYILVGILALMAIGVGWLGEPFGGGHALALGLALAGLLLAAWPDTRTGARVAASAQIPH